MKHMVAFPSLFNNDHYLARPQRAFSANVIPFYWNFSMLKVHPLLDHSKLYSCFSISGWRTTNTDAATPSEQPVCLWWNHCFFYKTRNGHTESAFSIFLCLKKNISTWNYPLEAPLSVRRPCLQIPPEAELVERVRKGVGWPCFVKPNRNSGSLGITKVQSRYTKYHKYQNSRPGS